VTSARSLARVSITLIFVPAETGNGTTVRAQFRCSAAALGATRFRLIREFLRESAMLCLAGGVLGYVLAAAALHWFSAVEATVPALGTFHLAADLRVRLRCRCYMGFIRSSGMCWSR
jgi:predicted lysophospholipase L1 biosynthesis ABC-type transport system permease subunit